VFSVPPRKYRDSTIDHNINPNYVPSHFHVTTGVRSGILAHAFSYATTAYFKRNSNLLIFSFDFILSEEMADLYRAGWYIGIPIVVYSKILGS
jgi:hypothetical protein